MVGELLKAAESGNLSEVKRLAGEGVDVDARRAEGGKTALMKASQEGFVDVVIFLLQKGANVDATGGRSGKTALMRASERGHWEVVEVLINARADINAKSMASGKTALMRAIEHGNLAAVLLLIQAGADVHVRDKKGRTAEDIGAECGQTYLVRLLRNRGADFSAHARQGERHSQGLDDDECYAILGCARNDSPEQMKLKYRSLMKQYHPDVIQAKGVPGAYAKFAAERFLLIQEAYQRIAKRR